MNMLPDINIPRSAAYNANQRRYGDDTDRCLICARPIARSRSKVVVLDESCGWITDPATDQEHTGGCFDIGSDCWKRHPELHPYEVKP